ncbi:cilia- and flagella-associated protein 91-like [Polyergus mexicanus]|uniref:cilia- and flagella-associated protein 91-like n=1 Tax=Polyergus mexicanus TaxID=615972 RepID=UPI0038B67EE9
MRNLLQNRESQYKKEVKNRFNRLQVKLRKHRDDQVETIRHNLKRNLRKLYRKYRDNQQSHKSEEHIGFKSDLYELQMRYGKRSQIQFEKLEKQFLSESYAEREKENTTLNWLPTIEKPKVINHKSKPIDICIRETRWTDEKLKQLYSDLKAIRMNVKSIDVIPRLIKRDYKQSVLPVTPRRLSIWNNKQKQWEESATFIQKLVKNRAIQCLMYKGYDRYRELIEELHSTQTLEQQDEQKHREKICMIELQLQNDQSIQEDRLCEILNSLDGKTICGTLDFLSKKLVRLEDERRAHAFALLAERERCMREAAEAGRRQLERNRRREFDEMFKQIIKVNQDSIEAYLEDIIREGIDWISDKTAKKQVLQFNDKVDDISKHALDKQDCVDKLAEKELIMDMIYNFVLPEVEKDNVRGKIRDQQQNYMQNAYISIFEKISNLSSIKPLKIINQKVSIKNKTNISNLRD